MRYWVYINDKVDGPYEEDKLVTLNGFSQDTLICSEEVASNGGQDWVKASSVFEFDEVPLQQETQMPTATMESPVGNVAAMASATPAVASIDTEALLAKLDSLTAEMSNLHQKLDSMQSHLDAALEENKQLVQQAATQAAHAAIHPVLEDKENVADEVRVNTITLTRVPTTREETTQPEDTPAAAPADTQADSAFPTQAAPKEEELIIRSALDSIYGGKSMEFQPEETFQDLLPQKEQERKEKEAAAVEKISEELTFTPVEEETQKTLRDAIITTPSADEAAKDALINELTASPKEDVLDQIIQEHQAQQDAQEQTTPQSTEEEHSAAAGLAAAGAALVGAAGVAAAFAGKEEKETPTEEAPLSIATDKENPDFLEEVLPASQMPEDVPATEPEAQPQPELNELPAVEETPIEPVAEPEVQTPDFADLQPVEDLKNSSEELPQPTVEPEQSAPVEAETPALQEIAPVSEEVAPVAEVVTPAIAEELTPVAEETAPAAQEEPTAEPIEELTPVAEEVAPAIAEEAAEEPAPAVEETTPVAEDPAVESAPEEEPAPVVEEPAAELSVVKSTELTDKDLQDAFGPNAVEATPGQAVDNNPNDLTEIVLKEGSTYLISDFVPPAQLDENQVNVSETADNAVSKEEDSEEKLQETLIQDMLAVANTGESTKELSTEGLPDDLSATQIRLENTIQAKRGASLDIKTVPMVPEPANTQRLDVNDLNDVNAQHDMKTSGAASKLTKAVIGALVGLLLLIIVYVLLGLLNLLPSSVNLFAGKQQASAATQATEELLGETPAPAEPAAAADSLPQTQSATPADDVLAKVQNFPLPNGMTLAQFIASKHAAASTELISWEIADGVEADNYSVTVKVPPENPQNFKTVYRFNYNTQNGMLEPTISDAKNLLDQAYGQQ